MSLNILSFSVSEPWSFENFSVKENNGMEYYPPPSPPPPPLLPSDCIIMHFFLYPGTNAHKVLFRLLYSNCLNWKLTAKITYHLHIYPQFTYESFHIHYIISLLLRENMNSQLTSLPMCGLIAQLVEHRTGIAEVTGSNPVEALIFFRLLYSNCLNWKFTAKITYHLHIYLQFTYESFHIHYIIIFFYG